MEKVKLNNGVEMPQIGLGTFMMKPEEAEEAVYNALKSGYRLIDTANAYMNERAVGRGIKKSGVPREEIFLESKLWPTVYTKETAVDEMLERLDVDYVDLLLIHQPAGDYIAGYKAMEKAYKEGKVKAIGLSNFEGEPLEEILIILRWHIQEGNIIIPGSKNLEHIKDNANIFDFELTDDEMNEIAKINKNQRYYIPNPELTASYATMELNPELDV